eukprot:m.111706 g.111706  ORF g.111706 m.111706 type:complete len:179 (-) comp17007_c0_seq40:4124-4660(-)
MEDIAKECLRIEEDCTSSKKMYWNERDVLHHRYVLLMRMSAFCDGILMAVTGGTAYSAVKKPDITAAASVAACATATGGFIIKNLFSSEIFVEKSAKCGALASDYDELHGKTRLFREIELPRLNGEDGIHAALEKVRQLAAQRNALNRICPPLWSSSSWVQARDGISSGEARYKAHED